MSSDESLSVICVKRKEVEHNSSAHYFSVEMMSQYSRKSNAAAQRLPVNLLASNERKILATELLRECDLGGNPHSSPHDELATKPKSHG